MKRMKTIYRLALLMLVLGGGAGGLRAPAQEKGPGHPFTKKHLYDETTDPRTLIADGLKQARAEHKRVILDFGGDWCPDCQVLDIYFHDDANRELLEKHFVVVHVFIGHMDKNIDLAAKYGVPIGNGTGGVPALAVLDSKGKLVYSQGQKQFSDMRHMESQSVTDFLNRWKS